MGHQQVLASLCPRQTQAQCVGMMLSGRWTGFGQAMSTNQSSRAKEKKGEKKGGLWEEGQGVKMSASSHNHWENCDHKNLNNGFSVSISPFYSNPILRHLQLQVPSCEQSLFLNPELLRKLLFLFSPCIPGLEILSHNSDSKTREAIWVQHPSRIFGIFL